MPRLSTLTPDQWALARRRWEGSDAAGFEWLRREMEAAFGVAPTRPAIRQAAAKAGWEKGGAPSQPLTTAGAVKGVAAKVSPPEPAAKVSRPAKREVASEVVDATPPLPAPAAASTEHRGPGRPSLYRPEFAALLLKFFAVEPYTVVEVTQPSGIVKKQRIASDPPMLQSFADSIGVSKATVDAWATAINPDGSRRYPDFCDAYARARAMQEALFSRAGMLGLYEPRFLAFAMKNLCGWQDQPAPKEDHAAVSKEELDRRFGQRMEAARQRQMAVLEERRALRRLADEAAGVGEADVPGLGYSRELGAGAAESQVQEADEAHG